MILNTLAWVFVLVCPITMPVAIIMLITGRE